MLVRRPTSVAGQPETSDRSMVTARLQLSIPDATWIADCSVTYPDALFRVIAVLSGDERANALVEIETDSPVPLIAEIERRTDVTEFELLWKQDDRTLVQVETTNPRLLVPVLEAGIPLQTPFEVRDGRATWEVTTTSDRLSALGSRLDSAGIAYEVTYVGDDRPGPGETLLTDRQREVLLAAAAQGYYDTPRRTTLTAVSESLGISKATGSDVLHRAEGRILLWFIEEYLAEDPRTPA